MTITKTKSLPRKANRKKTMAREADRYDLYQQSVQAPDHEVCFFRRVYKAEFGRHPKILREDFCGTHAICCEWVKHKGNKAIGVDIDPEPLAWGIEHNQAKLSRGARERIELIQGDVRQVIGPKAEVLAAENFSYWIFKTRKELCNYFKKARQNLGNEGLMVLDLMGGPESMEENSQDEHKMSGFTYIWDQARLDPISHHCRYHIHFHFPDGSKLDKSFTYDWRFWTIPELRELLDEAGFKHSDVYWEGTDPDTGEGNDRYGKAKSAANDLSWISYIVAVK